ncbi:MAG: hypothetical protein ACOYLQ_09655 [Hyphomicrobiaceae bacterium]
MSVATRLRHWLERLGIRRASLADAPPLLIDFVPITVVLMKPTPGDASPAPAAPAVLTPVSEWRERLPTEAFAARYARWMSQQDGLADTDLVLDEIVHYAEEFAELIQAECPSPMALTKSIGAYRSGTPRPWKYATDRNIRKQHYRFPSAVQQKVAVARERRKRAETAQLSLRLAA